MAKSKAEVRKSGMVAGDEIAAAESKEVDQPVDLAKQVADRGMPLNLNGGAVTRPEDKGMTLNPGFARMRTEWGGPDGEVIRDMHRGADLAIENAFSDVYAIFYSINRIVRVQRVDVATGEMLTDLHGLPVWEVDQDTGEYVEDWTRMRQSEREEFIYRLTTGLFRWERQAARMKGEALFARAAFEEAFAHGFEELPGTSPTIDDRTARARIRAADQRYFAVYLSYLLECAQSVVRAAERMGQRLRDLNG